MLSRNQGPCSFANILYLLQCRVCIDRVPNLRAFRFVLTDAVCRFSIVVIVALPIATPAELKNSAKVALWDFTNRMSAFDRVVF
jgi:hypothetical protein